MERHRDQKTPKRRMSFPVQKTAIVLAVISGVLLIVVFLSRNVFLLLPFRHPELKHLAHYALKEKPQFYYLELEKTARISASEETTGWKSLTATNLWSNPLSAMIYRVDTRMLNLTDSATGTMIWAFC